jgi:hypothetical protein
MVDTVKGDAFVPEVLAETVRGRFASKNLFMGSPLMQLGIVVTDSSFTGGKEEIGNEVTVPYFGTLGEFEANNTDGDSVTPKRLRQTSEKATVGRDSLAFEVTRWARMGVRPEDDPYNEATNQIEQAGQRAMDKSVLTAAAATGALTKDVYSTTTPRLMDYDLVVDAKLLWGDESSEARAMAVHSKTKADMLKLKDSGGRPMLQMSQREGDFDRFCGLPIIESDRCPLTGSTMGAVTSSGSSPPTVTLAGTPSGPWDLVIDIQTGGALGTATFKFSVDGGVTWSAEITTTASTGVNVLADTAIDSLVGNNGSTGITATFASGTYNADNVYKSVATLKATSLIFRPRALAYWFNRRALTLETDKNILKHSDIAAMHLYRVAHRYRRVPGGTRGGVIAITHNVSPIR